MSIALHPTALVGVFDVQLPHYPDERGHFSELYNAASWQTTTGQPFACVQVNHSYSRRNVLRGLHFQCPPHAQSKLISVLRGEILDVVVDLRPEAESFGRHLTRRLAADNYRGLFIPKGCAHGFLVLSEEALVQYITDHRYAKESEAGIRYDDTDLNILWPGHQPDFLLSDKDKALSRFADMRTVFAR